MSGLFGSQNTTIKSTKLSEFDLNDSSYGLAVPIVLGTTKISGNVIDWQDFTAVEHKSTQKSGKGGGSKTTTISYTYTVAAAIGICEGPANITRVWSDSDETSAAALGATIFPGGYGQEPWSYMSSKHSNHALAYSGLCYAAAVWDMGSSASLPQLNFEVQRLEGLANNGADVNPADAVNYILNNDLNGIGFGTGGIDSDSFNRWRNYAANAGIYITVFLTDQKEAINVIADICKCGNASCFWSQDRLKFITNCDETVGNYIPDTTVLYAISDEDLIPYGDATTIKFSRKDSTDCYNSVDVQFTNRANGYASETVNFKVTADIAKRGLRAMSSINLPFIHSKDVAAKVASSQAYQSLVQRNTYTFKLGWNFCLLEPGDLISITDTSLGLDHVVVQIQTVSEEGDGFYTFTAIEKPEGAYSSPVYDIHQGERPTQDYGVDPGETNTPYAYINMPNSVDGLHAIVAASGAGNSWGGANVWISTDDLAYEYIGKLDGPAIYGQLTADCTASDTEINIKVLGNTIINNNSAGTEIYVDGEIMIFTEATLTAEKTYRLSNVLRGQKYTTAGAHVKGAYWAESNTGFKCSFTPSLVGKTIYIKLCAYNIFGTNIQGLEDVDSVQLIINAHRPPSPTSLLVETTENGTYRFSFAADEEYEYVAGYELRYNIGKNNYWATAIPLNGGMVTESPFETTALKNGIFTVMVQAVDNWGVHSAGKAEAIIGLGDKLTNNVVFEADMTAWTGEKTNCHEDGGHLVGEDNGGAFYATDQDTQFYRTADAEAFYNTLWKNLLYTDSFYCAKAGLMTIESDFDGQIIMYYRRKYPFNFYGVDTDQMYKEDTALMYKEGGWLRYAGKVECISDYTEIKLICAQGKVQPIVRSLKVIVDVPDLVETVNDIIIPTNGRWVPVTKDFKVIQNAQITIQDTAGENAYSAKIGDKNIKNGVWIQLYDINGDPIAGVVDVTIQGY